MRERRLLLERLENRLAMAVFVVTNTADSGSGSFRQALFDANAFAGQDKIEFAIFGSNKKIQLDSPLPFVTDSVVIDGTTQPGFDGLPVIQLDGSKVTIPFPSGLTLNSNGSTVRGLHVYNFDYGISVLSGQNNTIATNALGADPRGVSQTTNRLLGVYLIDASNNKIGDGTQANGNLISGNAEAGIRITGQSSFNQISGNLIGTTIDGDASYGSQDYGVLIGNSASSNIVGTNGDGVIDDIEGNLISGNRLDGVRISQANSNIVAGNLIGTTLDGVDKILGQANGVVVERGATLNIVGTNADDVSDAFEANVVSGHSGFGLRIFQADSNVIAGNWVGLAGDGMSPLGNQNSGIIIDGGSSKNVVGMSLGKTVERNFIASNALFVVVLANSSDNLILGNSIGLSTTGVPENNGVGGIRILNSNGNRVGGAAVGQGNRISFLNQPGISVVGSSVGNLLTNNSFEGDNFIPIDLNDDERNINDPLDADQGPNNLQNYAVVQLAVSDAQRTVVAGRIDTTAFTRLTVEVLYGSDPGIITLPISAPLGTVEVVTDSNGFASWMLESNRSLPLGTAINSIAHQQQSGSSEVSWGAQSTGFVGLVRPLTLAQSSVAESVGSIQATVFRVGGDLQSEVTVALKASDNDRVQLPAQVVIPANSPSVTFDVQVIDDNIYRYDDIVIMAVATFGSGIARLYVDDNDSPWHNYLNPLDVTGNRTITPSDALQIINFLNGTEDRSLTSRLPEVLPGYLDVFLDFRVTPTDALLVINFLNSRTEGEGEFKNFGSETSNLQVFDDVLSKLTIDQFEDIYKLRSRRP